MSYFKHTGIYVNNLFMMSEFYKNVFDLIPICENQPDEGKVYEELYKVTNAKVIITKLVSAYGKKNGQGDMLELIEIVRGQEICRHTQHKELLEGDYKKERHIYETGMAHLAIGVDDIDVVIKELCLNGGKMLTGIISKGIRKCCFCTDPEGNFIELIE